MTTDLYTKYGDIFLKVMNQKWNEAERTAKYLLFCLKNLGIEKGNLLDLGCGNGRISVNMAMLGFRVLGIDNSELFLNNARKRAEELGVSSQILFVKGDVRKIGKAFFQPFNFPEFDVIVSAWTSIGMYSRLDDFVTFKNAYEVSREGAVIVIADTMHTDYVIQKFGSPIDFEIEGFLIKEKAVFDSSKKKLTRFWTFYRKNEGGLVFAGQTKFTTQIYDPKELVCVLEKSGWKVLNISGSIEKSLPLEPSSTMNIIATKKGKLSVPKSSLKA